MIKSLIYMGQRLAFPKALISLVILQIIPKNKRFQKR